VRLKVRESVVFQKSIALDTTFSLCLVRIFEVKFLGWSNQMHGLTLKSNLSENCQLIANLSMVLLQLILTKLKL